MNPLPGLIPGIDFPDPDRTGHQPWLEHPGRPDRIDETRDVNVICRAGKRRNPDPSSFRTHAHRELIAEIPCSGLAQPRDSEVFANEGRFFQVEVVKRDYPVQPEMAAQMSDRNEHVAQVPFALVARHEEDVVQAFSGPGGILQVARCEQVDLTAQPLGFNQEPMTLLVARQTQYVRHPCAAVQGDGTHQWLNKDNSLRLTTVIFFREAVYVRGQQKRVLRVMPIIKEKHLLGTRWFHWIN